MNIVEWLSETVKNPYWFKMKHVSQDARDYVEGYRNTVKTLGDELTSGYLTKEQYLKWRSLWRATYAKLSEESRLSKSNRKASIVGWESSVENIERVRILRHFAGELLELRRASRVTAEESFQRDHELAIVE